jgi:hypothetical protein
VPVVVAAEVPGRLLVVDDVDALLHATRVTSTPATSGSRDRVADMSASLVNAPNGWLPLRLRCWRDDGRGCPGAS